MAKESKNIVLEKEGDDILVLKIDQTQDFGASKSGKNLIVATTSGEMKLDNGLCLNINVYRKAEASPVDEE